MDERRTRPGKSLRVGLAAALFALWVLPTGCRNCRPAEWIDGQVLESEVRAAERARTERLEQSGSASEALESYCYHLCAHPVCKEAEPDGGVKVVVSYRDVEGPALPDDTAMGGGGYGGVPVAPGAVRRAETHQENTYILSCFWPEYCPSCSGSSWVVSR